jgi:hypothetical protein
MRDEETGRFLTGNKGGGRPKGARNKLGEAFVEALHDDFIEHGVAAIQMVRSEKPDQYLKVIASLLPKDVNLNLNNEIEMSDDEIRERIRDLANQLAPLLGGTGEAGERTEAQAGAKQPSSVH